jgi:hypothetical protein
VTVGRQSAGEAVAVQVGRRVAVGRITGVGIASWVDTGEPAPVIADAELVRTERGSVRTITLGDAEVVTNIDGRGPAVLV